MKKVLLSVALLALLGANYSDAEGIEIIEGQGTWGIATIGASCPSGQVSAEWLFPGSPSDGTLCCISQFDMRSNSFSACQGSPQPATSGPREGNHP